MSAPGPSSVDMLRAVRAQLVSTLTVLDAVIASSTPPPIEPEPEADPRVVGMGQDDDAGDA